MMLSSLLKVRRLWHKCFQPKYLFVTNTVSGGVLFAVGDGIQQQIERTRGVHILSHYDWIRTGRLFLVGLSQGPPHHFFYIWLDKILPKKNPKTVAKKIVFDQILAAPFFAITFFYGVGLLEGKNIQNCWSEFKRKFPAVYAFDWCFWPPSQAVNFVLVPASFRVLYINAATIIWDVFLSYIKHYDQTKSISGEQPLSENSDLSKKVV